MQLWLQRLSTSVVAQSVVSSVNFKNRRKHPINSVIYVESEKELRDGIGVAVWKARGQKQGSGFIAAGFPVVSKRKASIVTAEQMQSTGVLLKPLKGRCPE
jgi:hypothetical protein